MSRETQLEAERGRDVMAPLRAVQQAARAWAEQATDGAAVWELADELLPDLWREYHRETDPRVYETFTGRESLRCLADLGGFAERHDAAALRAAIDAARQAVERRRAHEARTGAGAL